MPKENALSSITTITSGDYVRVLWLDGGVLKSRNISWSNFVLENVRERKRPFGATIMAGTLTTGDGKFYFPPIPAELNGMNLVSVIVTVRTTSTSGTPTFQFARGRQASATSAHTYVDMLSTRVTIDANEYSSLNAAAAYVIDTANDDLATGDLIRCDIDVTGTGTADAYVTFEAQLP